MTSKALIYNVKQYKSRETSLEHGNKKAQAKLPRQAVRLPAIHGAQHKATKEESAQLAQIAGAKKNRTQAIDSRLALQETDPKERAKKVLVNEFGHDVDSYLKKLENDCKVADDHLTGH